MNQVGRHDSAAVSRLCSLGLFLAGYIFYSSSLIAPFFTADFKLTSWQIGTVQSAVPLGAMLGAVLAGWLGDRLGRNRILAWNFLLLVIVGLFSSFVFDYHSVCFIRFFDGFLAGTLYPLCAAYLTEMTPERSLARQTAVLMFVNCLAAPAGCITAILLSLFCNEHILWRILLSAHVVPALFAYAWTKQLPESGAWMLCENQAHVIAHEKRSPWYHFTSIRILFSESYRNMTICLIGAWFLMDVAYYGINFFVPYLLQLTESHSIAASQHFSLLSDKTLWGTFVINIFFAIGAFGAIFIVEKVNLFKLQKYGFLFAGLSLFLLAWYFHIGLNKSLIIILLFALFNFAINLGPDVTTYLLSATSYPVKIRASGHGFISGCAKLGSFLGVLFLPNIQAMWGHEAIIMLLAILLFAACLFTSRLAKTFNFDNNITKTEISYETN
jgi:MFS transporter, putative metabolite transport protein